MRNVILIVLGLAACVPWPLAAAPIATDFLEGFNARYECLAREGLKGFHCRVACSLWDQYLADRRAKWGPRDRRVLALDKVRFTLDYPVKGRLVAGAEPVLKTGGKALEDEAAGVEAAVKGMLLEHLGPWLSLAVRPAGGEAGDPDRKVVLEPGAGGFLVFQESGQPVTEFFDMGGKIFELARGGTEGVQSFKPDLQ
ncbi:MAG TPA: hypothetical protein VFR02_08355, partial [bacterium]|nr:hypothetical protein [bacterium]